MKSEATVGITCAVFVVIVFAPVLADEPEGISGKIPRSIFSFTKLASSTSKDNKGRTISFPVSYTIEGAKYQGPCNYSLYENYILPMYRAKNRGTFQAALYDLYNFMTDPNNWPNNATALEPLSCFSFKQDSNGMDIVRYMDCVPSSSPQDYICNCSAVEPYKSVFDASSQECELEEPSIGTPCLYIRSELLKDLFFNDMRDGIAKAKRSQDVVSILNNFTYAVSEYVYAESIPGDIRLACFNLKNQYPRKLVDFNKENLECSKKGKCACIQHSSPRFNYVVDDGKCLAEQGAICTLKAEGRSDDYDPSSGKTYVFSDTFCRNPDLQCGRMNGIMMKEGTKVHITSCGGRGLAKNAALAQKLPFSLIVFTLFSFTTVFTAIINPFPLF